jgi:hypothetical protein
LQLEDVIVLWISFATLDRHCSLKTEKKQAEQVIPTRDTHLL